MSTGLTARYLETFGILFSICQMPLALLYEFFERFEVTLTAIMQTFAAMT